MLLSRVAESVYWAGRYLERAEATARLAAVHTELFMDLPLAAGIGWEPLLAVTGSEEEFVGRHDNRGEDEVVAFLLSDPANSSSVISSLVRARENFRITRACLPKSAWQTVNEARIWAMETADQAVPRPTRLAWAEGVVRRLQQVSGLLAANMSHDATYSFLEIGRLTERADMTTRVLDVQAGILMADHDEVQAYADVTWMSVLRSLSALQMFRRSGVRVTAGPDAIQFLLKDPQFPRSLDHCLTGISRYLLELPVYDEPMAACAGVQAAIEEIDPSDLDARGLHEAMDQLQQGIGTLHNMVASSYFNVGLAEPQLLTA